MPRDVPALDLSKLAHERARKPPTARAAPSSSEPPRCHEASSETHAQSPSHLQMLRDYQNVLAKHVTSERSAPRPNICSSSPRYESPSCTQRTLRLSYRDAAPTVRETREGSASSAHSTPVRNGGVLEASRLLNMFSEERRSRSRFESPSAASTDRSYDQRAASGTDRYEQGRTVRMEREIGHFCSDLLSSMGCKMQHYDRWQEQAERVSEEVSKLCSTIEAKSEEVELLRQHKQNTSPQASVDEMANARAQIEALTAQLSVMRSIHPAAAAVPQPAVVAAAPQEDEALVLERESLQTKLLNVSRGLMRRGRLEHEMQQEQLKTQEAARLLIVVEQANAMFDLPAEASVLVRHVEGLDKEAGRVCLLLSQWHGLQSLDIGQAAALKASMLQSEQKVLAHATWLQQQLAMHGAAAQDGGILSQQKRLKETVDDLKAAKAELLNVKKNHFSLQQHHTSTTQQLATQTARNAQLEADAQLLQRQSGELQSQLLRTEVEASCGDEDQAEKLFFQIQQLQRKSKAQSARVAELETLLLEKAQEVESLQQQLSRLVAEVKTNLQKRKSKGSTSSRKRQPLANRTNLPVPSLDGSLAKNLKKPPALQPAAHF